MEFSAPLPTDLLDVLEALPGWNETGDRDSETQR
jgi:hypothetical protein